MSERDEQAVAWRRKENNPWWTYYETAAWPDCEPLYPESAITALRAQVEELTSQCARWLESEPNRALRLERDRATAAEAALAARPAEDGLAERLKEYETMLWRAALDENYEAQDCLELLTKHGAVCPDSNAIDDDEAAAALGRQA